MKRERERTRRWRERADSDMELLLLKAQSHHEAWVLIMSLFGFKVAAEVGADESSARVWPLRDVPLDIERLAGLAAVLTMLFPFCDFL